MNRIAFTFLFSILTLSGFCQLIIVPIQKKEWPEKKSTSARTQDIAPLTLPFWDDFSGVRHGYADSTKWEFGNSVWVNDGMGINPPSLNVATFDGLDSLGKPYNVNDILAKGFADKIVSAPIRMDLPSASERLAISITFFYQFHGNGEAPDVGDLLSLSFKNDQGLWEVVWSKENDGTLLKENFVAVTIPITAAKFFHDTFQFRFQNFARLSGPYDTWHVDYIYIGNGKPRSGNVYPLFPDRTIIEPMTSIFSDFRAIPLKHFFSGSSTILRNPSIKVTNLRADQNAGNQQTINYNYFSFVSENKKDGSSTTTFTDLGNGISAGSVAYNEIKTVTFTDFPDPNQFDPTADSINIRLMVQFQTKDDTLVSENGDYDFDVFNPIAFSINDSISSYSILSNYYAYDDGSAEYGAGLNQAGAQLAYLFEMKTDQPDTIVAVDMYFPRFGDDSNQIIQFQILKNLSTNPFDIIYQGNIPIQRNSQNKFWRIPIVDMQPGVKDKFYIGWKQTSSAVIAVGLDKNTESGDKIYTNINGAWEQNTTLKGSLMIRPVFGSGKPGVISGVGETPRISVYPVPNQGTFYISSRIEEAMLVDVAGRKVAIDVEKENEQTKITIHNPTSGLYLLRTFQNNRWKNTKVIVQH